MPPPAIRILWQSFLDPERHRAYFERLRGYLAAIADPGVEFDLVGLSPPDEHLHRLTELRCGLRAIHAAVAAERALYDAFVLGHFQEPGLEETRAVLDVPVVGLGESALLCALTLGRRIGLVTIDPVFIPWHEEQVARHGLGARVVGVAAMRISPAEFMAAMEPGEGRDWVLRRFEAEARALLDRGAEVLVPAGGLPALAFRDEHNLTIDGARVVNPIAIAAKQAEAMVKLRRLTGVEPSRRATYAKPSAAALEEFLRETD